jgi:ABC-type lipoprotein release transport system permease subunit
VAPAIYLPYLQSPTNGPSIDPPTYEVRTVDDPLLTVAAVRNAVREVEPNLPLTDVRTQLDEVDKRLARERLMAFSASLFGGLTLVLASTGLFGLMSYSVARRKNEIGIRMAIGARRGDVIRMVMNETLTLVIAGIVAGLAATVALSQVISSMLFGLAPSDPMTIAAASMLLLVVASVAGYLPARRASRVDPLVALRHES